MTHDWTLLRPGTLVTECGSDLKLFHRLKMLKINVLEITDLVLMVLPPEHNSPEDVAPDEERRRRRRRKRKSPHPPQSGDAGAVQAGKVVEEEPSETAEDGGEESLSKNRKRKLKKKRHQDKLRSMGLIPRASALEFTYKKVGGGADDSEEDFDENRATEVSAFLRTTMKLYASDGKMT